MKEREPTKNERGEATFFLPTTEPPQPLPQLADGDGLKGLVDLEAAARLCTALKANVLGIKLNVPVSLSLLLNACGRKTPRGSTYQCFVGRIYILSF
ncbi:hypothetical protein F2Q70_00025334 [Brassica cretica]|uniref:Hydrophobic seed protein domain-containing protein n=1 Tax=Brassica cretica TaxID=69181 RepID=A0A8S9LC62_BRACR|nr:hypothetical protein F2Q70_00025334 [Brassica cretica]